jgi:F-type H+-transporting ATPase subunit delta
VRGASRDALAVARERLDEALRGADDAVVATTSADLLSVARLLSHEPALTRALADPGTSAETRGALLETLLGERLSPLALDVMRGVVGARWSAPGDLIDGVEALGAQAAFEEATREGTLDEVEDELFRFARIIDRAPGLRSALTDPAMPVENKRDLVHTLLANKVTPVTATLVESVVLAPRGRPADRAIDELAAQAAARRQRQIAVVRVAIPLDEDLRDRLAAALEQALGHAVRLQVETDPSVVGGIVVRVGDELIDGSVIRRLAQARRGLTTQ